MDRVGCERVYCEITQQGRAYLTYIFVMVCTSRSQVRGAWCSGALVLHNEAYSLCPIEKDPTLFH
jgi:hypothetical protein